MRKFIPTHLIIEADKVSICVDYAYWAVDPDPFFFKINLGFESGCFVRIRIFFSNLGFGSCFSGGMTLAKKQRHLGLYYCQSICSVYGYLDSNLWPALSMVTPPTANNDGNLET